MKKIALISYGCAKNLVDSEVMLGHMEKAGYSFVTDSEEADILILNTCGFIEPAKKEARDGLKNAVALKKKATKKRRQEIMSMCRMSTTVALSKRIDSILNRLINRLLCCSTTAVIMGKKRIIHSAMDWL